MSNDITPNTTTKLRNGVTKQTTSDNGGRLPVLVVEHMPIGQEMDRYSYAPQGVGNVTVAGSKTKDNANER